MVYFKSFKGTGGRQKQQAFASNVKEYIAAENKAERKNSSHATPTVSPRIPAAGGQLEKKVRKDSSGKKASSAPATPVSLVPWSKKSKTPPKHSNGWSWKGEGMPGKVLLGVRTETLSFTSFGL